MADTYIEIATRQGTEIPEHLVEQADVPVITGMQRQGDVLLTPTTDKRAQAGNTVVPKEGVAVVRGENGGNTHLLQADGPVTYEQVDTGEGNLLGFLHVPEGSTAVLTHPEHGSVAFGPGDYQADRKVEQADLIRRVAD